VDQRDQQVGKSVALAGADATVVLAATGTSFAATITLCVTAWNFLAS
jgi:hypothetical protein